jgi:glutathione S-transferase
MEFDGMIAGSEVFRNTHADFARRSLPGAATDVLPAIPALVERGRQTLARFFHWLEVYLDEADYLAGDVFTMVDITAVCAVDFAGWCDIRIPPDHARTLDWYARVSARPSASA